MSPGTTQNDMITKAEIMEKAALKIDLSEFPAESLEKLNEMFNGDYAGAMAKTDAEIEKGVDLYLSAVGRSVEVWHKGKSHTTWRLCTVGTFGGILRDIRPRRWKMWN